MRQKLSGCPPICYLLFILHGFTFDFLEIHLLGVNDDIVPLLDYILLTIGDVVRYQKKPPFRNFYVR
jgi:hypothetical protein